MKTHFSAAELAGLPGLPTTERGVQLLAQRSGWPRAKRMGRGGGWEYPLHCLPAEARAALILKSGVVSTPAAPARPGRDHLWSLFDRKPDALKEKASYRLRLLAAVEVLVAGGTRRLKATAIVADQADEPAPTLRRWFGLVRGVDRTDWLPALAPRWAGRTATVACSVEAWDFWKALYLRPERPAAENCYRDLERTAAKEGWTVPACRTLQRRVEREFSPMQIAIARYGEDAAKRMYPAQQRDKSALKALECVNADGHKLDIFCQFEDGSRGRPIVSCWQDIYSGKILSWRIGVVESAETIRLSFADLVERFGIPDFAVLDNGRGFASKWMTGGQKTRYRFKIKAEEPQGVLTALGVEAHWAQPYSGQSKPIERAFRDLCEDVAKDPRFAGAWTGNSPVNKPENHGSHAVPIAEVKAVFAERIMLHNARPGRRSPVAALRSFDEVFAESYAAALIRKATAEQRRLLLLAAEGVAIDRTDSSIRFMGNRYWCDSVLLSRLAGRKVVVRFDGQDLTQPLFVYRLDGSFVAAAELVEQAGFLDVEAGKAHQRDRKRHIKTQKELLDLERRMDTREAAALLPKVEPEPPLPETKVLRPIFRQMRTTEQAAPTMTRQEYDEALRLGIRRLAAEKGLNEAG